MQEIMKDFIGIFPNAATKEYCEKVIKWFEFNKKGGFGGQRRTRTRQENEPNTSKINKESDQYFFETETIFMERNLLVLEEFGKIIWTAYSKLQIPYGAALDQLSVHKISAAVKIQRYEPTQGYHIWHCDNANTLSARRVLVCMLYLNTVKKGGETEFLYQSRRIPATQGTLVLFPTTWTHLHRGNPPLKGYKYILNTWLEFSE